MAIDDVDGGRREGLTSSERKELVELRRRTRVQAMEIGILKRASLDSRIGPAGTSALADDSTDLFEGPALIGQGVGQLGPVGGVYCGRCRVDCRRQQDEPGAISADADHRQGEEVVGPDLTQWQTSQCRGLRVAEHVRGGSDPAVAAVAWVARVLREVLVRART